MRVLGIDPGIARVGWGIVDGHSGKYQAVAFDCFTTLKDSKIEKRLDEVHQFILELIQKFQPEVASH